MIADEKNKNNMWNFLWSFPEESKSGMLAFSKMPVVMSNCGFRRTNVNNSFAINVKNV